MLGMSDVITILSTLVSVVVAIWIPYKIKWEQQYSGLLDDYRSMDYAIAFQGIIEFFAVECEGDVERIPQCYREHFIREITEKRGEINKDNCLHFQRRLLAQFFWQLNECAKSRAIGKRRVMRDFTASEAKLLKILIYIGDAIDNDDDNVLFKDISSDARVKKPEHLHGQNKALGQLYYVLKNSRRFMDVP